MSSSQRQNNTTTKELLKDFLVKQIYQTLSKQKFKSILKQTTKQSFSKSQVDEFYDLICQVHAGQFLSKIDRNIERLNLLDTSSRKEDAEMINLNDQELEKLIISMMQLNQSIEAETERFQKSADQELEDIKELVDQLSDLKYGKVGFEGSLNDLIENIVNLEGKFNS